jgi:hypothetical protein
VTPRSTPIEMDGTRYRCKREHQEQFMSIGVVWNFTVDEFQTFRLFFDSELENGELSFLMDVDDVSTEVGFLEEPPFTFTREDGLFMVSATLEIMVEPAWPNSYADSIASWVDSVGVGSSGVGAGGSSGGGGGGGGGPVLETVLESEPAGTYANYLPLDYYGGNALWSDLSANQKATALLLIEDYMTRVLGIVTTSESQKWWELVATGVTGKSLATKEAAGSTTYEDGFGDGTVLFGNAYALWVKYDT